jgi:hypothetical protein
MQQRLGGNAADVEAGTAEGRALFNNRNLETELSCLDRSDVAARAGSDNDHIIGHCFFSFALFHWPAARAGASRKPKLIGADSGMRLNHLPLTKRPRMGLRVEKIGTPAKAAINPRKWRRRCILFPLPPIARRSH